MIINNSRAFLKTIIIAGLFWFGSAMVSESNAQNGGNLSLNSEELFDFWIGAWAVSWDEGNGQVGNGLNVVEKILDDTVIRETFRILEGNQKGFKGTSISVYNPQIGQWKQAWADNSGGYFDFTGDTDGDKRIFRTDVRELDDGRRMVQRMVFYDITQDSLMWDWEASYDGGETWTLNWRIRYERI